KILYHGRGRLQHGDITLQISVPGGGMGIRSVTRVRGWSPRMGMNPFCLDKKQQAYTLDTEIFISYLTLAAYGRPFCFRRRRRQADPNLGSQPSNAHAPH